MWCCLVDYLTKWVEAFVIPDQRAKTIVTLFVEHVVCRHGVPEELPEELILDGNKFRL